MPDINSRAPHRPSGSWAGTAMIGSVVLLLLYPLLQTIKLVGLALLDVLLYAAGVEGYVLPYRKICTIHYVGLAFLFFVLVYDFIIARLPGSIVLVPFFLIVLYSATIYPPFPCLLSVSLLLLGTSLHIWHHYSEIVTFTLGILILVYYMVHEFFKFLGRSLRIR